MLRPAAVYQDMNADALLSAVALRDDSIDGRKIKEIKLVGTNRSLVQIDDDNINLQPLDVFAKFLNAPTPFLASADLTLAQQIVDYQFNKVKEDKEIVFKNNKAVGHQPAGNKRITGLPLVQELVKSVGEVRRANLYDMGGYVDVCLAGDKITLKPKVNDITEGGLRLLYSELHARPATLEPYVERLLCTNGMICSDRLESFKFETMEDFMQQIRLSVVKAMKFIDTAIRAQLEKAAQTKIDRSEQALRQIFESNRITPRLLPSAIAALTSEEDGTAFGVLQAITRTANTTGYTNRALLQSVGAREMARLETVHCPTCWSTLTH
jgi:hypothetical protein